MFNFKTLPEAVKQFSNEEYCRDLFEKIRWPDGNIICPLCLTEKAYRMSNMRHYKCRNKSCGRKFTVTQGSMLEATKLPLGKWFTAMWLVTAHKKGVSSHQIARDLGIRQKAGWFLLCRIREILKSKSWEKLNNMVEVDETYVGGKLASMTKSRRAKVRESGVDNKTAVMGIVQRDGRARLSVIGHSTFKEMIRDNVNVTAHIVTDSHLGYQGLSNEFAGHNTVNHSIEQYKDGIFNTNSVEGAFSHFKRMIIGTYHSVSPKHLHRYCEEFSHRWNTRKTKDVDRFIQSLTQTEGRLKWKDLVGDKPARQKPYTGIEFINGE